MHAPAYRQWGTQLLPWSDPFLTAWLEEIRGELLAAADFRVAKM